MELNEMLSKYSDTKKNTGGEFELIARLRNRLTTNLSDEVVGQLDDGFIIPTTILGKYLVSSVDSFIEGRHFLRKIASPEELGFKAMCTAFSDLAAMLARPQFGMIALNISSQDSPEYLEAIYDGVNEFCELFQISIVGGNISRASELSLTVTAVGGIDEISGLRSGAQAGEDLWITGGLGYSYLGLEALARGLELPEVVRPRAESRWRRPIPRFSLSEFKGQISSCIDISDGIFQDASHIALQSDKNLIFELPKLLIPELSRELGIKSLLGGGDYELLFSSDRANREHFLDRGYILCGRVSEGPGEVQVLDGKLKSPYDLASEVGSHSIGCDHTS